MNKKELIEKIKTFGATYLATKFILEQINQLDEPQPLKLKDIISRMKQLFPLSRSEWIDEILHEFGEEFGSIKYRSGYEQGKLEGAWVGNQLKDADKIRQELNRVKVPQCVHKYIQEAKEYNWDLQDLMNSIDDEDSEDLQRWFYHKCNQETLARAWLDGYEVEEEKRYTVVMKPTKQPLYYNAGDKKLFFSMGGIATNFTQKQLEEASFGWVFDCEGIEVEEVE
jgi:gp178|nr:MAG TPA: Protein of unknown function (DUF1642) [Caudoviricetes sp.]